MDLKLLCIGYMLVLTELFDDSIWRQRRLDILHLIEASSDNTVRGVFSVPSSQPRGSGQSGI